MDLQSIAGVLGLVGPQVNAIADTSLKSPFLRKLSFAPTRLPYHITLVAKDELRTLSKNRVSKLEVDTRHVFAAGVGGDSTKGAYFVVIIWAAGQKLRKQLGLSPKHFYLTLSISDFHDADKGVDRLFPGEFPTSPNLDFLDHLAFTLYIFHRDETARRACLDTIRAYPQSERGYLRLADTTLRMGQYKISMLSYACTYQRSNDGRLHQYCINKMIECSHYTEWGRVFTDHEISQLPEEVASLMLIPWTTELCSAISDAASEVPTLCLESRERSYIPIPGTSAQSFQKLPRFFRWLVPFHFAIMSTPRNESDIAALELLGIRRVLTLTEETLLNKAWFSGKAIRNTFLPISNYHAPTIEQMDVIIRLFEDENNLPLLVHCGGGKGRAGTAAACYLAAFGFRKPEFGLTSPTMSAPEAISALRAIRPGSIETSQQETFVSKWCSTIWKRQSITPTRPSEPSPCPLVIEGVLDSTCDLFALIGLPGSGKSWFSNSLVARNPRGWTRISQDESGSRSACENEIGRAKGRVLLDRCNTASADRKSWLELAALWTVAPAAVWFDYDRELCTSRAQNRTDHPTLTPGSRVRNAVEQMHKVLSRPTLQEGFKAVVIVRSFAAAQDLVARLSPPLTLFKFPRTEHLIDLGAATSDDIVTNNMTLPGRVVITEKVDGANMGFSLSSDRSQIVTQNRSHYVNSSSHEQFRKLGAWIEQHEQGLRWILDCDEHFAERYILFGEWMSATHSIPYTRLPDRFMAFDLYDRKTDTWADRSTLSKLLVYAGICIVPLIYEGPCPTPTELKNMVQLPSKYYDGRVEGIYVKTERNGVVASRGKIVRSDFIAGNEHWTKGKINTNAFESEY